MTATPGTVLLDRGRLLCDMKPRPTAFGLLYEWTVEDLDADDPTVVASGLAADPHVAWLEVKTAALADVRHRNLLAAEPLYAQLLAERSLP